MARRHTIDIHFTNEGGAETHQADVHYLRKGHALRLEQRVNEFGHLSAQIAPEVSVLGLFTVSITQTLEMPDKSANAWDDPRITRTMLGDLETKDYKLGMNLVSGLVAATTVETDRQALQPVVWQRPIGKRSVTDEDIASAMAVYGD